MFGYLGGWASMRPKPRNSRRSRALNDLGRDDPQRLSQAASMQPAEKDPFSGSEQ